MRWLALLPGIVMLVLASAAHTQECRKTGSRCVEGAATRTINGAQIYKSCWRERDTYECVAHNTVDTCATLRAAGHCTQTSSVCAQRAFNNECLQFTNQFTCTQQMPLSAGVVQLDSTFTVEDLPPQTCEYAQQDSCVQVARECVQPGGTRVINGKSINRDCWEYQQTYHCVLPESDCAALAENSNCQFRSGQCLEQNEDGSCALRENVYQCADGTSADTTVTECSDRTWCVEGQCFEDENTPDSDFAQTVASAEMMRQAAGYASGGDNPRFFSGDSARCGKNPINSCCKSNTKGSGASNGNITQELTGSVSGSVAGSFYVYDTLSGVSADGISSAFSSFVSGNAAVGFDPSNIGLSFYGVSFTPFGTPPFTFDPYSFAISVAILVVTKMLSCDKDEGVLAMRRGQRLCTYVGAYCSKKFLGVCLSRKQAYCCYNSRLARIIQEQGRAQLGKSYGNPKAPDCSGFTVAEFESLDFSRMDLSAFFSEVQSTTRLPDASTAVQANTELVNQRIRDYYNQ